MEASKIKVNDVFKSTFTDAYVEKRKGWDLRHCFEGLLVARLVGEEIVLFDSFWGVGRSDNKAFKLSEIGEKIDVQYYCNLDEIEKSNLGSDCVRYYDENDIIVLHDQHACVSSCIYYYTKKGAVRSKDKMKESFLEKIERAKQKIKGANYDIERANESLLKIDSDYLTMYI